MFEEVTGKKLAGGLFDILHSLPPTPSFWTGSNAVMVKVSSF